MEIVVGAAVTVIVQLLKKLWAKVGGDWALLIVVVLTFIGAYLFHWGKGLVTQEMIETWGQVAGYQFIIWGLFIKWLWPKLKTDKE